MSGFCGIKNFNPKEHVDKEILHKMCRVLGSNDRHNEGNLVEQNIGLGCGGREAIDLIHKCQPLHNEDNTIWIVSEGTIYNFMELRSFLEGKGHRFYTDKDSEIAVHLYEELEENFVSKIFGNYAFALWDKRKDILILARDQLGIKPLYYTFTDNKLIFASEIKPMLIHPYVYSKIDLFSLCEYLSFEYVPGPRTIFEKIKKLLPGHLLIGKNGRIQLKRYWNIPYQKINRAEDELCKEITSRLKESIRYSLTGTTLKGVLLSGGIDSSIIVALMKAIGQKSIRTFSATFENELFDESINSQLIAKYFNTNHHQVLIKPEKVLEFLPDIIDSLDEPLADASIIPTYLVTHLAKEKKVDICLTGDGGDELFGGYDAYRAFWFAKYLWRMPRGLKRAIDKAVNLLPASSCRDFNFKIKKFIRGINFSPEVAYYVWWGAYTPEEKFDLFTKEINNYLLYHNPFCVIELYLKECSGQELLDRIFYMDLKFNLPDGSLRKTERMGAINSLEVRPPFLLPSLVEFSATIPNSLKLKGLTTKYILRKAIKPYLPFNIFKQPKRGFDIPLGDWMRRDLKTFIVDILSESAVKRQGFFNYSYIKFLLKEHFNGKQNHRQKIWPLVVFTHWYETIF